MSNRPLVVLDKTGSTRDKRTGQRETTVHSRTLTPPGKPELRGNRDVIVSDGVILSLAEFRIATLNQPSKFVGENNRSNYKMSKLPGEVRERPNRTHC